MNLRTTLLLLMLAGAVVFAVLRLEKWAVPTTVKEQQRRAPLKFDPTQADEVQLVSATATTSLKVRELFWRVGAPVDDVADTDRVTELLKALSEAEWLEELDQSVMSASAWEMTGLGESAVHMKVLGAGILLAECWVGHDAALEGACYISLPQIGRRERKHFVARTKLSSMLKAPAEQWRDRTLVHMPASGVSSITVQNGVSFIEMHREKPSAPWQITKPMKTRGHTDRINQFLGALVGLKIQEISQGESSSTPVASNQIKIALHSPALPKPIEVTLDPLADQATPPQTTARASHRKGSFKVSHEHLSVLWKRLNDLRDNHLVRINADRVTGLKIESNALASVTLRKNADFWQVQRHGAWIPANADRVSRLLTQLNEHEIIAFASDSASSLEPFGLAQPFLKMGWSEGSTPSNEAVTSSSQGGFAVQPEIKFLQELLFGAGPDGKWYAKNADEPFVYQISPQLINAFPRDAAPWKSLYPARFTQFALKQISIALGANPPVILDYDPTTATWKGSLAGRDISALIDRVKADTMASRMAGLRADEWLQDRSAAAQALQQPELTIRITVLEDPTAPAGKTKVLEYNFAPTQPGVETPIYYGRLGAEPDMFVIMRDQLLRAVASVLKQPASAVQK
ncbi:MAG: DUF4340 domain-containing protein [Verrucomicrobiaceae bacterium]|nr:DUF4340 domain-containing protein [Verrucomicrobiaceae bacterium]